MKRRHVNWKALRVISQTLAFLLFIGYFLALVYPLRLNWPTDLVFQLDPLTHLYLFLSGNGIPAWAWALLAVLLLFVLSRLFCGWVCPLGAMLDFVSGIRGRLKLVNRSTHTDRRPPTRLWLPANFDVYLLLALLVLAALGSPLLWLLDPIVFSFKFTTIVLYPVVDVPMRALYNLGDSAFYATDWWGPVQSLYNKYFITDRPPVYTDTTVFLVFAAIILGLEFLQRRFWCRYICPLGALLRLTYLLHLLRRRIRPDCAYCFQCEVACHFGGSVENDCLYCMECIQSCKLGQISFLPGGRLLSRRRESSQKDVQSAEKNHIPVGTATKGDHYQAAIETLSQLVSAKSKISAASQDPSAVQDRNAVPREAGTKSAMRARIAGELEPEQISRRLMLEYIAAGFVAYPLVRLLDLRSELPIDFIRPPGVVDEERFTELCIKCGQCLKVCLTNGLQPALTEAGLSALWTPRLISRQGECAYDCNLCGQVCPSGAIPNLALEDKKQQKLGMAYIDLSRCIPFDTSFNCTVCEEHCPTPDKAIKYDVEIVEGQGNESYELLKPYVVPELCIGCGICERVCPVSGVAAIRIFRRTPGAAYSGVAEPAGTSDYYGYPADNDSSSD